MNSGRVHDPGGVSNPYYLKPPSDQDVPGDSAAHCVLISDYCREMSITLRQLRPNLSNWSFLLHWYGEQVL